MVHEGLAQGGEPRQETSAKQVGGPGAGAALAPTANLPILFHSEPKMVLRKTKRLLGSTHDFRNVMMEHRASGAQVLALTGVSR